MEDQVEVEFHEVSAGLGYTICSCLFNNELYQVYTEASRLFYQKFDGQRWYGSIQIPHTTSVINILLTSCVYKNNLFVFYQDMHDEGRFYYATFDGVRWDVDNRIPSKSNFKPSAGVLKDRLYLIYKGAHSNTLFYAYFNGINWTVNQKFGDDPESNYQPEVCLSYRDDCLCVVYKGAHSNNLYTGWLYDNGGWIGNKRIESPELEFTPRIRLFNGSEYLVYDGTHVAETLLNRCSRRHLYDFRIPGRKTEHVLLESVQSSLNVTPNLYLFSHNISAAGGEAIVASISRRPLLKRMSLNSYAFGDEVGQKFLTAVKQSISLDEIELINCGISSALIAQMQSFLSTRKKLMTDFMNAIRQQDLVKVRYYLAQGISLDYLDEKGNSALHNAVNFLGDRTIDKAIVVALLNKGANANLSNLQNNTALDLARAKPELFRLINLGSSCLHVLSKEAEEEYTNAEKCLSSEKWENADEYLNKTEAKFKELEEYGQDFKGKLISIANLRRTLQAKKIHKEAESNYDFGERYSQNANFAEAEKFYKLAEANYQELEKYGENCHLKLKLIKTQLENLRLKSTPVHSVNTQPTISSQFSSSHSSDGHSGISTSSVQGPISLPHSLNIPKSQLKFEQKIGEGGFGTVFKGMWQSNPVAIKQLQLNMLPAKYVKEFKEEVTKMMQFHSPSIIALYGVTQEQPYCMVMEFMDRGSLRDVLDATTPETLSWRIKISLARDVASGLSYLHPRRFVHGDIKSLNILVNSLNQAKLADFGLTTIKTETASRTVTQSQAKTQTDKPKGSLLWMAPELFKRSAKLSYQTDIYSFGVVLWELASHEFPFKEARGEESLIRQWIQEGEREKFPEGVPVEYQSLAEKSWLADPTQRPTAEQALAILEKATQEMQAQQHDQPDVPQSPPPQPSSNNYLGNIYPQSAASDASVGATSQPNRYLGNFYAQSTKSTSDPGHFPVAGTQNVSSVASKF